MANAPAVTISDVAERAGVSVGTVSNVVNRPDRVTESTRIRVRDAISTLGWVPNGPPRRCGPGRQRSSD